MYYQVRYEEQNGEFTYSDIVMIECDHSEIELLAECYIYANNGGGVHYDKENQQWEASIGYPIIKVNFIGEISESDVKVGKKFNIPLIKKGDFDDIKHNVKLRLDDSIYE